MRLSLCVLAVAGCGEVAKVNDAGPSDSNVTDAPSDASIDAVDAPPDAPARFPSGTFSFEEMSAGNPTTPFTAQSGIVLSKPDPNPTDSTGMFVVDCNGSSGAFGFGCDASRQSIPDGLRFIVLANLGASGRFIEFTFPQPVGSFSVAITNTNGATGQTYAVAALTDGGIDLDVEQIQTVAITGWAGNRVTVAHADGFKRVVIRNVGAVMNAIAVDAIQWTSN